MDEARRVGQAVPKYTTQAQAAVARASRLGGAWGNLGKILGKSWENHFFTWFYHVLWGLEQEIGGISWRYHVVILCSDCDC